MQINMGGLWLNTFFLNYLFHHLYLFFLFFFYNFPSFCSLYFFFFYSLFFYFLLQPMLILTGLSLCHMWNPLKSKTTFLTLKNHQKTPLSFFLSASKFFPLFSPITQFPHQFLNLVIRFWRIRLNWTLWSSNPQLPPSSVGSNSPFWSNFH